MNPSYCRIRVPQPAALERFAAWQHLPQVGPLVPADSVQAAGPGASTRDTGGDAPRVGAAGVGKRPGGDNGRRPTVGRVGGRRRVGPADRTAEQPADLGPRAAAGGVDRPEATAGRGIVTTAW